MFKFFAHSAWKTSVMAVVAAQTVFSAAADPAKIFTAEYTIPVQEDDLKPFSTHKIDSYRVTTGESGQAVLSFEMPEDLSAGLKTKVSFNEIENDGKERVLKGPAGTVRCSIPWLTSNCRIEFSPSVVPPASDSADFLLEKYGFAEGWVQRLLAVDSFSTEPIGNVRVLGVNTDQ
ncbi:MAG: hypothetical protein RLZZ488_2689 [Pseudomonadota bacterium]|jgi:hypothetical protein